MFNCVKRLLFKLKLKQEKRILQHSVTLCSQESCFGSPIIPGSKKTLNIIIYNNTTMYSNTTSSIGDWRRPQAPQAALL
jgi:hypothetical protein